MYTKTLTKKLMKTKEWTLVIAMVMVLLATAFANNNDDSKQQRSERIKERISNFKENIKPKIDAQRNKLEPLLSAEDKEEIKRLREEITKQRLLENEFIFEAREARIKGEEYDEGLREEIEAQRIVIENLHDQAKLIVNKYRPEIDEMVATLRDELREDIQNARPLRDGSGQGYGRGRRGPGRSDGYGPRGDGFGNSTRRGFAPDYHHRFGPNNFGGFGPGMFGGLNTVGFLLWDVNRG